MKLNYCMFALSPEHDKMGLLNKKTTKNWLYATIHKEIVGK